MPETLDIRDGSRWSLYWRPNNLSVWEMVYENMAFHIACRHAHIHLICKRGGQVNIQPTPKERVA